MEYENEALSQDQKEHFEKLRSKLVGTTFHDRLRRWVGELSFSDWKRYLDEPGHCPEDEAAKLAEEAYQNPELLRQEIDWLCSDEVYNIGYFGKRLGELDIKREWLPELIQRARQGRGSTFLVTYLLGRREAGDEQWCEELLDRWVEEERDLALAVLEATWRCEPSVQGVQRLIRLVEKGWLEPSQLWVLVRGNWVKELPTESFYNLLNTLMRGERATEAALMMLHRRLKVHPEERNVLSPLAWWFLERPIAIKGQWLQNKLETARKWLEDPHPNVRRWVRQLIEDLEQKIIKIRRWEEEEDLSLH